MKIETFLTLDNLRAGCDLFVIVRGIASVCLQGDSSVSQDYDGKKKLKICINVARDIN